MLAEQDRRRYKCRSPFDRVRARIRSKEIDREESRTSCEGCIVLPTVRSRTDCEIEYSAHPHQG